MSNLKLRSDTKILILISLLSLFTFVAYWTYTSYENFFGFITGSDPGSVAYVSFLGHVFWIGHIGLTTRIIGVFLGILSLILLTKKTYPSQKTKKIIGLALILESIYFISFIPYTPYLWREGFTTAFYLGLAYFLQFLLVTPTLLILAFKTIKSKQIIKDQSFWKWAGITSITYIAALWINNLSRWFDMAALEGILFLFQGTVSLNFLNSIVFMSLALIFSVFAAHSLTKTKQKATKYLGLALAMIGIHYTIYLLNSYLTGMLNFALLIDIWTIPLLPLGLSLILGKAANKTTIKNPTSIPNI